MSKQRNYANKDTDPVLTPLKADDGWVVLDQERGEHQCQSRSAARATVAELKANPPQAKVLQFPTAKKAATKPKPEYNSVDLVVPQPLHVEGSTTEAKIREHWLQRAAMAIQPILIANGAPAFPLPQVSVGYPVRSKINGRPVLGECHGEAMTRDGNATIFIVPTIDPEDPMLILGVLTTQMILAAVGVSARIDGPFAEVAGNLGYTNIGVEGGWRGIDRPVEGSEFEQQMKSLAKSLGPFPHDPLQQDKVKPAGYRRQIGRNVKYTCTKCGMNLRIAGEPGEIVHKTTHVDPKNPRKRLAKARRCGGVFKMSDKDREEREAELLKKHKAKQLSDLPRF
jgi:hypothetical protein